MLIKKIVAHSRIICTQAEANIANGAKKSLLCLSDRNKIKFITKIINPAVGIK